MLVNLCPYGILRMPSSPRVTQGQGQHDFDFSLPFLALLAFNFYIPGRVLNDIVFDRARFLSGGGTFDPL